ncbi:MAG: 50S ribosomal protein L25/general stress protein Ctc [Simkaniaceae bacterium]
MKLTVEKREAKSKGELNKIRQRGDIPAVLYASGQPNKYIVIKGNEFISAYRDTPKGALPTITFEMEVDGELYKAVVKEIQYHPTTYVITHLDFLALQEDKPIKVNVPVRCIGVEDCIGIKLGGFLRQVRRHVQVRCMPKDLPKEFLLDIRDLKIRGTKRVKDIKVPEKVRPLINPQDVLAVIAKR